MNRTRDNFANIWVISDTHLKTEKNLPVSFVNRVGREDLIIHLGDITSLSVVRFLQSLSTVMAVSGNCDSRDIRDMFPSRNTVTIGGHTIAMTHGRGSGSETVFEIRKMFEDKVDIALFGHTHLSCHFKSNGTLFFNPGSLTRERGGGRSFGLLHLDSEPWAQLFEI